MASGDAQKVWFPELIAMVRQAGDPAMSMDALLRLRDWLNTTLQTIRHTRQILPAMMQRLSPGQARWRPVREGVTLAPLRMADGAGTFLMRYAPGSRSPVGSTSSTVMAEPPGSRVRCLPRPLPSLRLSRRRGRPFLPRGR